MRHRPEADRISLLDLCLDAHDLSQAKVPKRKPATQENCAIPVEEKAIRAIADKWKHGCKRGDANLVEALHTDGAHY